MSDDLVKHLRSFEVWIGTIGDRGWKETAPYKAADRIEKLEAALREIINKDTFGMDWAIRTAREALEKKDALDR